MTRYAAATAVPMERTRAEIENTLKRYGATSFAYGWEGNKALIGFQMAGRRVRTARYTKLLPRVSRDAADRLGEALG